MSRLLTEEEVIAKSKRNREARQSVRRIGADYFSVAEQLSATEKPKPKTIKEKKVAATRANKQKTVFLKEEKMRAARTDGNQTQIVNGLRAAGISVSITSAIGQGFPDLVCGYLGRNFLLEIKDPTKPKADRQLTPDQVTFRDNWKGQYSKVETLDDAIKTIQEYLQEPIDP